MHFTKLRFFVGLSFSFFAVVFASSHRADASLTVCERGAALRNSLEMVFGVPCADIKDEDLAQVTDLSVASFLGPTGNPGDLDGLVNLKRLQLLGYSGFFTADVLRGYFEGVPNLETLEMVTDISDFPVETFSKLPKLKKLYLELQGTQALDPATFDSLTNLEELSLGFEKSQVLLEKRHLEKLGRLTYAGLMARTTSFSSGFFSNNPLLEGVALYDLGGFVLSPEVFSGLSRLEYVQLFRLKAAPPEDLFKEASGLKFFGIYDAIDLEFPVGLLANSPALETIDMFSNLFKLPANAFQNNRAVVTMKLRECKNFVVTAEHLENQTKLEELKLEDLSVSLPEEFVLESPNLKIVTVTSAKLSALPKGIFSHTPKLEYLTLYSNPFTAFPLPEDALAALPKLAEIDLQWTGIPKADIEALQLKWPNIRFTR